MSSVTDINTSGDNDNPIFPVEYEMHYMYCDVCGSFDIKYWHGPDHHDQLRDTQKLADRVAKYALIASMVSILPAIFTFSIPLVLCLAIYLGAKATSMMIESRIKILGVRCQQCQTAYIYGSPFFTVLEANPRGFTMEDVPRPLNMVYQITGNIIRDDERNWD